MESIREQMTGTTVAQKPNQGSPRPRGGIKRRGPFFGTLAPVLTNEVGKQKSTV